MSIEKLVQNKYKAQTLIKFLESLSEDESKEFHEKYGNKLDIINNEVNEQINNKMQKLKEENEKYMQEHKILQEQLLKEQEEERLEREIRDKALQESMDRMNKSLDKLREGTNEMVTKTNSLKDKFKNVKTLKDLGDTIVETMSPIMEDDYIDTIDLRHFLTDLFLKLLTKSGKFEETEYIQHISTILLTLEIMDNQDKEILKGLQEISIEK
jgi:exonuclease VII large subunit